MVNLVYTYLSRIQFEFVFNLLKIVYFNTRTQNLHQGPESGYGSHSELPTYTGKDHGNAYLLFSFK